MGAGASASDATKAIGEASVEDITKALEGMSQGDLDRIKAAMPAAKGGPIDTSGLTKVATDDDGLSDQPAEPKFKVGLVESYNKNHPTGGSDKLTNKHRFDSIPIANGVIKTGMSCQIFEYHYEEHDKFMEVAKQFNALIVRCNPGHIDADGGSQQKFDKDMQDLAGTIPIWPTADVMTLMGAKDALVKIKDMGFGMVDTLGYYSPEDMQAGFPKAIGFQPRVVKQNRGSAGEGIWIIKLKSEEYCPNYGDKVAAGDEVLILKEANDNHVEEHTVDEFIEFCTNGRTDKSGEWTSQGTGKYFEGGAEAGGQMVDQRFVATIDTKGESRFFMCGLDLYNVEHYLYIGGVSGETKTTVHDATAEQYAETRKQLEEGTPEYMKALGLDMSQLPLLWAADFLTLEDGSSKIGEFNCSCLGVTGFLDSRGKDHSACKPEDIERGQAMCDHIGKVAFKALENWKK